MPATPFKKGNPMSTTKAPRKKASKSQAALTLFQEPSTSARFEFGQCAYGVGYPAGKLSQYPGGSTITGKQLHALFGVGKWSEWYGPAEVGMSPVWTFLDRPTGKALFVCTEGGTLVLEAEHPGLVPEFMEWLVQRVRSASLP